MMKQHSYQTFQLPCGLRIVCAPSPTDVVYGGVAVDAGTRDELSGEDGMAHFVEHMCFKGTSHLSSRQIINRMESVGGDLNAYTGKEETVYYATFLQPHLSRAIQLLLDIVLHSTFPQAEIDREVEVVIDEIESYNDQPSELIYDEFESDMFPSHPLGRNILGKADCLRTLRSADVMSFYQRMYRPERMVLFVYGNVPAERVVRLAEKCLETSVCGPSSSFPKERKAPLPMCPNPSLVRTKKDTHLSHVLMGASSFGVRDPRYLSLYILNNILGGPGMNSRLNLSLREKHGLVYTVESSMMNYTDAGLWSVYFGCDAEDVSKCHRLVLRELRRLTSTPLSSHALDAARKQLKGQISISQDNFESFAIGMAKRYLHYGTTLSIPELFSKLDALTPEDLWHTSQAVLSEERIYTLIYD